MIPQVHILLSPGDERYLCGANSWAEEVKVPGFYTLRHSNLKPGDPDLDGKELCQRCQDRLPLADLGSMDLGGEL